MTCELCQDHMADAHLLMGEHKRNFEVHIASCAVCGREYELLCRVDDLMVSLPLRHPPVDFKARVLQRVGQVQEPTYMSVHGPVLASVFSFVALWVGVWIWISQVGMTNIWSDVNLSFTSLGSEMGSWFGLAGFQVPTLGLEGVALGLIGGLLVLTGGLFLSLSD